jgi:crotonobetainyl-CoA:carnitine CoA-transferase CaiB-like acyl-CoA transferase
MFETMASFMLVEHANGAMFNPPLGPAIYPRAVAPNRRPYRTSDGYISALIYNDKQWSAFVEAVRPAWATDPQFATLELRARQIDRVYALIADTLKQRTTQEWLRLFRGLDIPAAPLRTPGELFDNPHLNAVGLFETIETPNGPVRFPGVPTWFSRTPGHVAGAAPELGANTKQVLEELGLTAEAVKPVQGSGQKTVL